MTNKTADKHPRRHKNTRVRKASKGTVTEAQKEVMRDVFLRRDSALRELAKQ